MEPPNRRTRYFIDKRMQGIWALLNLSIAGIIALFIGFEIMRSFFVEFGWPLAGKPFNVPDFMFVIKIAVLALIGSGFFWMLSAYEGHRIAGPIYKLEMSMRDVTKGNYSQKIQFRKNDFFQHVADIFNEMTQSVDNKLKEKEELLNKIREKVMALPKDNIEAQDLKKMLGVE